MENMKKIIKITSQIMRNIKNNQNKIIIYMITKFEIVILLKLIN